MMLYPSPYRPAYPIRWTRAAAGSELVIPMPELKSWLNRPLEDTFWDEELTSLLLVAQRAIENAAQIILAYSTWTGTTVAFSGAMPVLRRPFVSVTGIQHVAADGEITTTDSSLYHALPMAQDTGAVFLGDGQVWPETARRMDAVRITAKAGYAVSEADVTAGAPVLPDEIRHALKLTVASMDANRGDTSNSGGSATTVYAMKQSSSRTILPMEARTLIAPYSYRHIQVA